MFKNQIAVFKLVTYATVAKKKLEKFCKNYYFIFDARNYYNV
jgi:hypothetical protein